MQIVFVFAVTAPNLWLYGKYPVCPHCWKEWETARAFCRTSHFSISSQIPTYGGNWNATGNDFRNASLFILSVRWALMHRISTKKYLTDIYNVPISWGKWARNAPKQQKNKILQQVFKFCEQLSSCTYLSNGQKIPRICY